VFVSVTRYDRYESESPDASGSLAHAEPGLPTGVKARLPLEFEGVRIAAPSLPTVIARPSPATASAAAQARAASNPGRGAQCHGAGLSLHRDVRAHWQPERGMQRHVERAPTRGPPGPKSRWRHSGWHSLSRLGLSHRDTHALRPRL
jgi:hypothetical protein